MNFLIVVALALTPAAFWMWWYYRKDMYDKEPMRLVALVFVLATPLSVLCGLLEYSIDGGGEARFSTNFGLFSAILFYIGIVGVFEEIAKLFVVYTLAYRRAEFNEPMDGIVYSAAAALGFATLENIFYIIDEGPFIILLRGPLSTLGHILFSGLWGAALGLAKFEPDANRRRWMIIAGLFWSIIAHGTFDVLISLGKFFPDQNWLSLSAIPFLAFLYYLGSRQISHALKISDFNPRNILKRLSETPPPPAEVISQPANPRRYAPNPNAYRFRNPTADTTCQVDETTSSLPEPEANNDKS